MRGPLALGLLLLSASTSTASGPTAVATASKTEVSVGEGFTVEVRAQGPPGTVFTFPGEIAEETLELTTAPPDPGVPVVPGIHRYRASVFALTDVAVPPITVRYRLADGTGGEVATAALPLRVGTLLPKAKEEQKLADVRGPIGLAVGRLFWIGVAALAALLLGLAAWLWIRRRRRAAPVSPAAPPLAPDAEARAALAALAASDLLGREEFRPFYIALTAIAKRYLERRLEAPILEMTTAEMLHHLRQSPHTGTMGPLLRDLSGAADQIKFARGEGVADEAARHLASVAALIEALEAKLRPAEPEGGKAA
jgi:hypothetical protein